jgi:general secretion pathway protein B
MSYILDALRKSDQQRQHGKAPTLLSAQNVPSLTDNQRQRFNTWIAAALIGLGILIGWLRPWQSQTTTAPVTRHDQPAPAAVPQAPSPAPLAQIPAPLPKNVSATPTPEKPAPKHLSSSPPDTAAQSSETSAATATQEQRIVRKDELPPAVRQNLPDIAIAFHQYSNTPGERRVMINNIVLRQGDWVAPGLRLEQITAQGVVLSSQGIQFLHSLK